MTTTVPSRGAVWLFAAVVLVAAAVAIAVARGGSPIDASGSEPRRGGPTVDRFDAARAFAFLRWQVEQGPRPAGSPASRRVAARLRALLPRARYQPVGRRLRNVLGTAPGRDRDEVVVVGAHYDTKDAPGFVGANDAASGTAVVVELARVIKPGSIRPTVVFVLFDGEESPAGTPAAHFEERGLRGSKVAARRLRGADAMILLDMVADRDLSVPRERNSDPRLWRRLRAAATRVGAGYAFPSGVAPAVSDDHVPFLRAGVPAIDVIDFDFPCWHKRCDNLRAVSQRSIDTVGETVLELLRSW